jgi:hypothetical protein
VRLTWWVRCSLDNSTTTLNRGGAVQLDNWGARQLDSSTSVELDSNSTLDSKIKFAQFARSKMAGDEVAVNQVPTPLSTRVCSSYICYVVALIACVRSTLGNDCILSSFFSFIFHFDFHLSFCRTAGCPGYV